jgi:hypothetical protein
MQYKTQCCVLYSIVAVQYDTKHSAVVADQYDIKHSATRYCGWPVSYKTQYCNNASLLIPDETWC